ncbi:hypothetical protein Malapachy_3359 [Malassezia pachydermatis]|uniref:Uncharacterized protein n=1 Tax=Malassezia pachydermatis TaxID=77020 RepID=A0A0M8MZ90_9BASI|nr:hypothetical protein Malapachy_3359 [Malassezia pachydermatis]KOS16511.1 hypothetical protein Malapachy_3359 [Malassezia pachydermatis]
MPRPRRPTRKDDDTSSTRRSTRPRRARVATTPPSDAIVDDDDDSDVYSEAEPQPPPTRARSTRASSRRGRTPRDHTPGSYSATPDVDDIASEAEAGPTVDIEGQTYRMEDDALVLETDPAGETKVNRHGHLLGGREYRVPTFRSPERDDPERLYMLSLDIARELGYRDSSYFFRKHPLFYKLYLTQDEKDTLIADGRLNNSLRTRNVTVVTARSVFQQMGARVVVQGRQVTDDYYEAQARAEGKREGMLVTLSSMEDVARSDRRRENERDRDRGRRRTDAVTHTTVDPQGEMVTTTFGDDGQSPFVRAGTSLYRRGPLQRADVTEENWMAVYAKSVREMNTELLVARRDHMWAMAPSAKAPATKVEDPAAAMKVDPDDHLFCDTRPPWERAQDTDVAARQQAAQAAQRRARRAAEPPIGLYDPHTHTPLAEPGAEVGT